MLKIPGRMPNANKHETQLISIDVPSLVRMARRQLPIIIFFMLLGTVAGTGYVFFVAPTYTAKAVIVTDPTRIQLTKSFEESAQVSPSAIESQVEVLKSEAVLVPVIRNLGLTKRPKLDEGGFFSKLFGLRKPDSDSAITQRVLAELQDKLKIARIGRTPVIEISYKSADQDLAALVPNAVVESYIADQQEARTRMARQASSWLQERLKELGEQAAAAERAVASFKKQNNIVDTGGKLIDEQRLGELNSKLTIARSEVSEARAKLSRVQAILARHQGDAAVDATVADALKSEVVTKLRNLYLDLSARSADYTSRFGANHLAVVRMRNQMQQIRTSINDELQRLAETYKSDLEIASQKHAETEKELAGTVANSQATSQAQIRLRELESSARSYRELYDSFLKRNSEQIQQQSMRFSEARLISPAHRPLEKSGPKILFSLAIAAFGGTFLGLGVAAFREMCDRVFRTGEQVEKVLSKNCLSLVPKFETVGTNQAQKDTSTGDPKTRSNFGGPVGLVQDSPHTISNGLAFATAVVDAPFSRFAEAIHHIKLAAECAVPRGTGMVIGVTSALSDEGKTTIAVNLARLIAQTGVSTVLVDCDLRVSALTKSLSREAEAGVTEVVAGKASLQESLWKDELTSMMFLPAHGGACLTHPNEILSSDAAENLFQELRKDYKWVVVDLPPIEPVIDVRSSEHLIDSYVLVIEWGHTRLETVKRALSLSVGIDDRLLGVILNKVDLGQLSKYNGYARDYGDKYYALQYPPAKMGSV